MDNLQGTWKLVSLQAVMSDNGERIDMYGESPVGYLILTERRWMTVITRSGRSAPNGDAEAAALFETMMAYTGEYTVDSADVFAVRIDVAWHPSWVGQVQSRLYKLEGEVLTLRSGEITHPMFPDRKLHGVITWRRA